MRPLACILWLEQNDSPPPTSIHDTLAGIELRNDVHIRLMDLMERKRNVAELGTEPHDSRLDAFIEGEIARISVRVATLPDDDMDVALLDELLWAELGV